MLVPYVTLENFFSNFSFCLLFISMIFYWVQTGFMYNGPNKTEKELGTSQIMSRIKNKSNAFEGYYAPHSVGMILANFSLFSLLVLRWKESGHFPLSNLYESLMFLSWSFTTIQLIVENILGASQKYYPPYIGCITSPSALFTNAFATFSLPIEMQKSSSLVPALQSNWLMMHVTVMILSYAALICGSLLSIAFLIITKDFNAQEITDETNTTRMSAINRTSFDEAPNKNDKITLEQNDLVYDSFSSLSNADNLNALSTSYIEISSNKNTNDLSRIFFSFFEIFASKNQNSAEYKNTPQNQCATDMYETSVAYKQSRKIKLANSLDNLSYRILGLGFPLLTIGILSGAVWANEAWGSYWSWDPKETWAFLTWLVFAIYLHTRFTKGWQGKKPAIIASLGFVTVWVCFLGVNLIGEGLHSYGWIQSS
jgi:cytochrome c-type biogenesis protein CcsB